MKTIKNLRITAVLGLPLVCATLMSCSQESLSLLTDIDETSIVTFTDEEKVYLANTNKENTISPEEAMSRLVELPGNSMTRGANDIQSAGVIYKEEIGEDGESMLPDTLAYFFESKSMGRKYIVSADNRTGQSVLAEYNVPQEGQPMTDTEETIKDIIRKGIANYVKNEVINYESKKDSIINEIKQKIELMQLKNSSVTRANQKPGYGDNDEYQIIERTESEWELTAKKDPMIQVKWNQRGTYNESIRDTIPCDNGGAGVPAGCGPIAVAQILSYWKNPLLVNGEWVDWNNLTSTPTIFDLERAPKIAALIKHVFIGCNTIPGCGGSSTTYNDMFSYFDNIGFHVDNPMSYSASVVRNSIINDCPVLITGINSNSIGHAWNIDGYEKYTKTRVLDVYVYDRQRREWVFLRTDYERQYSYYYSYNWGWQGHYNGWFAEGCFDYTKKLSDITRGSDPNTYDYNVIILPNIYPNN